jgi:hypothetical protein
MGHIVNPITTRVRLSNFWKSSCQTQHYLVINIYL